MLLQKMCRAVLSTLIGKLVFDECSKLQHRLRDTWWMWVRRGGSCADIFDPLGAQARCEEKERDVSNCSPAFHFWGKRGALTVRVYTYRISYWEIC